MTRRAFTLAELTPEMRAEVFELRTRGCTSEEIVTELRIAFGVEVDWSIVSQLCRQRVIDRPGRTVLASRPPSLGTLKRRMNDPQLPLEGGSDGEGDDAPVVRR